MSIVIVLEPVLCSRVEVYTHFVSDGSLKFRFTQTPICAKNCLPVTPKWVKGAINRSFVKSLCIVVAVGSKFRENVAYQ